MYRCPYCLNGFDEGADLIQHLRQVHGNQLRKDATKEASQIRETKYPQVVLTRCNNLLVRFARPPAQTIEERQIPGSSSKHKTKKKLSAPKPKEKHRLDEQTQIRKLTMGGQTKTVYGCGLCAKIFSCRQTISVHIKCVHFGERRFQCMECPKRFGTKPSLQTHMRAHSGVKPYKCDLCPKAFSTKSNLNVHLKRHLGIQTHNCTICSASFTQKMELNQHILLAHNPLNPYNCSKCACRYKTINRLKAHLTRQHKEKE